MGPGRKKFRPGLLIQNGEQPAGKSESNPFRTICLLSAQFSGNIVQ